MSDKLTDEEKDGLSEEEIAALEGDDEESEEELEEETADDEPEEKPDDDPEEPEPKPGDEPAAKDEPEAKPDAEPEAKPEPEAPKAESPEFTPQYNVEPVEDFDGKMEALATQKKDLRQKYQDGDITHDEYEDQRDVVEEEVLELRDANLKYNMAVEQNEQATTQRWQWEQDRFFAHADAEGVQVNKVYEDDPMIGSAFNTAVKALAADEANENQPMAWFLETADKQVRERFKMPDADPDADKDAGKDKDKNKKTARKPGKPDLSGLPPANLGDLPAAEQPETSASKEFAHLEKLNGMELENALAQMTPAQEARYLEG